jgi:hypothetical protein
MKHLRPDTLDIVQRVEALSGCPVELRPDSMLEVQATLQKARNGAAAHVLRYRPGSGALDYWVAYQCAYALRFYALPPHQRLDLSDTGDGTAQVESWLMADPSLAEDDLMRVPMFARQIEQWALMTVLSYPLGMRIDRWLHREYPALRVEQAEGMAQSQSENLQLLSLAMGRLKVPQPLLGMPAAYALLADSMLGTSLHSVAWRDGGALAAGQVLFGVLEQHPDDPAHDRDGVDAWAQALGMSGWYRWQPYRMQG